MASLNSNSISGITTTAFFSDSAVNKSYIDTNIPTVPENVSVDRIAMSTNGTSVSWNEISSSFEYSDVGISTFNIPTNSVMFFIEAMSGGQGGSSSQPPKEPSASDWKIRTMGFNAYYPYRLNYGGGLFLLSSSSATGIVVSTDAITWNIRTLPNTSSGTPFVDYANNLYFGSFQNTLSVSTDSISWTLRTLQSYFAVSDVKWDGVNYYLLDGKQSTPFIRVSTDTIHWKARTGSSATGGQYLNNMVVAEVLATAVGQSGTPKRSVVYVAGSKRSTINFSTDGIHWALRTAPTSSISTATLNSGKTIAYGDSKLYSSYVVAAGLNATIQDAASGFNGPPLSGRTTVANGNCRVNFQRKGYESGGAGSYPDGSIKYFDKVEIYDDNNVTQSITYINAPIGKNGSGAITQPAVQHVANDWVTLVSGEGILNSIECIRTDGGSPAGFVAIRVDGKILQDETRFISGHEDLTMRASTDSLNWVLRTIPGIYYQDVYSVATNANGSLWAAVGSYGLTVLSTDTIHWTLRTVGYTDTYHDVAFGENAISWSGTSYRIESAPSGDESGSGGRGGTYSSWYIPKAMFSPSASTMTINVGSGSSGGTSNNPTSSPGAATTISWTGPDNSTIKLTSPGAGTTTTDSDAYAFSLGTLSSVDQTRHGIQATGGGSGGNNGVGNSSGAVYNSGIIAFGAADQDAPKVYGLPCGAGGGGGSVLPDSNDYPAWSARTIGYTGNLSGAGYAFGLWTIFGSNDVYKISTDSIHWVFRTAGGGAGTVNFSFAYDDSDLAILGHENGRLSSTTDAIHFTARTTGLGQNANFNFSGYLNNLWIAAGQDGNMAVSTDAIHWTLRTTGSSNKINQIAYGSGNYILGDQVGRAASSTDTIHWISRTVSIDSDGRLQGATYSDDLDLYFISGRRSWSAYSAADFGAVSTDTIHWTLRTLGLEGGYNPAISVYADGIFTLTTDQAQGRLATSTDSIHWKRRTSNGAAVRGIVRTSDSEYGIAGTGFFSHLSFPDSVNPGKVGFRGGGGGGGSIIPGRSQLDDQTSNTVRKYRYFDAITSDGAKGGDGYVKITWY